MCEIKNKPYEGYIEKLKEPIELKGRVIKYKPVAKLSGKSGAKSAVKKGGMRGGRLLDFDIPNRNFKCVNEIDPNIHTERKLTVCCEYEGKQKCLSRNMGTQHKIINNSLRYGDIHEELKINFLDIDIDSIKKSLGIPSDELVPKNMQDKFMVQLENKGYITSNPKFLEYIREKADFAKSNT